MLIDFDEQSHTYSLNGDIASISVTELLRKHGLAPDYSKVSKAKLEEASAKGKEVHKDLEYILNEFDYEPKTLQGCNFKAWVEKNIDSGVGEQMLGYESNGFTLCGTADVMGQLKTGEWFVGDHKNTAKFNREYVSWQVSLLDYMARNINGKINERKFYWKGATKFFCFHYDTKSGELSVKELDKIPDAEIERLIQCEMNGEIYKRQQLAVDKDLQKRFLTAEEFLVKMELVYKEAEANAKALREEMLALFEKQGIKTWESPNKKVQVTYVEPIDKISVDSQKLKKEFPQVYTECQKLTKTKAQLRVKVREEE